MPLLPELNSPSESKYEISPDVHANKIYIKKKRGEKEEKRVQIFALKKEFPFLFANTVEISSEYFTWISLPEREDFLDWKRGGCIVRILSESSIEEEILLNIADTKTKTLFVVPHLSTGGCPQYLLKKIETYKDVLDIYVIEYNFLGNAYVVQRNRIIDILKDGRFFSLGERDKNDLLTLIEKISPEVIHFEEIPETFVEFSILEKIYTKPNRKYFITETTHSSRSVPEEKKFLPDKFIFCSRYSQEKFRSLDVPSEVWEYPVEHYNRPDRSNALKKLGLDPEYVHILNVGLFTPGKNQGELFDLARKFSSEKVLFHFVGNRAQNFEDYWGKIMPTKPENCILWDERPDVENFLASCDIFYFSSTFELNPLVVKEALSWKMPVLMYDLETYMGAYNNVKGVTLLNGKDNEQTLRQSISCLPYKLAILRKVKRAKIVHIVSEIASSEMEKKSIESVSQLCSANVDYTVHYNPPTTVLPSVSPLKPNEKLRPGHFGCFEAFRKAIAEDFTDEYDYVIVCERDCLLEKPPTDVLDLLERTFQVMEKENVEYFSFGDTVDLDHGYPQSEKIRELPGGFAYLTDKIIGLQFIIFSKPGRDFLREKFKERGWYGMDIWLNIVFEEAGKYMGILNERVTTQMEGYSLIDQKDKIFKANHK